MAKHTATILLVEDEEMLRRMYEEKFTSAGYKIITAEDGLLALEKLKTVEADLILLDVLMPNMDGFQVLKRLRNKEKYAKVPIIMLTNNGEAEIIRMCKMMGATDYFVKANNTPTEVVEKIKEYIEK